ncbi:MAG: DUF3307 domain-containing protein [Planctomycetota bacterium]
MASLGSPEGAAILALLFAGHSLADFVFQSPAMVEGKHRDVRLLFRHGWQVFAVHALVLLPFLLDGGLAVPVSLAVAIAHVFVDAGKPALGLRVGVGPLGSFFLDQALHAATLVLVAAIWASSDLPPEEGPLVVDLETLRALGVVTAAYAFAVHGGSAVVAAVLASVRPTEAEAESMATGPSPGRVIGILERLLVVTLVWLGEWSAVGFVLAAKSVARFKELDDRNFAETYLIGTLTSVLVAGALGLAIRILLS